MYMYVIYLNYVFWMYEVYPVCWNEVGDLVRAWRVYAAHEQLSERTNVVPCAARDPGIV